MKIITYQDSLILIVYKISFEKSTVLIKKLHIEIEKKSKSDTLDMMGFDHISGTANFMYSLFIKLNQLIQEKHGPY